MATAAETGDQIDLAKAGACSALFVFVESMVIYWLTLAPTVTFVDSGELIAAAATSGVAHPPGFPLYLLVAKAATLIPAGSIATRVHMLSAVFAALASAMMTLTIVEAILLSSTPKRDRLRKKKSAKTTVNADQDVVNTSDPSLLVVILVPAIIGGLVFAFSRTLWGYATIAEVYTLNSFLILTVLWLMLGWRREQLRTDGPNASDRKLYIAAFVFGLGLCVHHVSVALLLPALAVLVFVTAGRQFFLSKRLLYATLISLAGLSVYIYLPLAASQAPLINWGDPSTLERFWWHISGKQYLVFFNFTWAGLAEFFSLLSREFSVVWLPLALVFALIGLAYIFRRDRTLLWFVLLVIAANLAYCLSYEIADDKDAYYLPTFIALVIAAAIGTYWLLEKARDQTRLSFVTPGRVAIIMLAIPVSTIISNYSISDRSRYFLARDYVHNAFRSMEPGALLLTGDWQLYSPSLYIRDIDGERKDTTLIDVRLLRRSWYFNYIDQAYPGLADASRGEIDSFLEDLHGFDLDPRSYDSNAALNQRINDRYDNMIASFITKHLTTGNVYVTLELAAGGIQEPGIRKALGNRYELIPEGLVFRISEKSDPKEIKAPELQLRGLNDGTVKLRSDDVARRTVIPIYLNMLTNTGSYLASKGQHERAIAQFNLALSIDPTFEPAKRSLAAARRAGQNRER